ncbi:hypothetical protein PG984_011787 [Apiospora sp. TS-2023a]
MSQSLIDDVNGKIMKCATVFGSHKFVPAHQREGLLTKENVKKILDEEEVESSDALTDFILQKAGQTFLTLVWGDTVGYIVAIRKYGFDDSNLPLEDRDGKVFQLRTNKEWAQFSPVKQGRRRKGDLLNMHDFINDQWMFLSPSLIRGSYSEIPDHCGLPLVRTRIKGEGKQESRVGTGSFSTVYRLALSCGGGYQPPVGTKLDDDHRPIVAVKIFSENLEEYYHKERASLQKIQTVTDNEHLMKPIAAFQKGPNQRCFMFPWADGGNLLSIWRKIGDGETTNLYHEKWSLKQMAGISTCLKTLYEANCRHGDLKPENTLHLKANGGLGRLVIADFGLTKFYFVETRRREGENSSFRGMTLRYQPPEFRSIIEDNSGSLQYKPTSRDYDMWSMGCILLEFTIILIFGWEHFERFKKTDNQYFWELEGNQTKVHQLVENQIQALLSSNGSTALKEVVTMVHDRLLVVKTYEGPTAAEDWRRRPPGFRASAHEFCDKMKEIERNAGVNSRHPARPSKPNEPSQGGRSNFVGGNNADQGTNRQPTDQQSAMQQASNVKDQWESYPDKKFASDIISQLHWYNLKPVAPPELCASCNAINFSLSSVEIPFRVHQLQLQSASCAICRMITQQLVEFEFTKQSGTLVLDGSTLRLGSEGPALPTVGSPQQQALLSKWLHECDQGHGCYPWMPKGELPIMPTRVLYVGSDNDAVLKLIEPPRDMRKRYVTLSHCWGNLDESDKFCTTTENIGEMKRGVDMTKLPKSFRHAVEIARAIKICYLWIDSICIVQDDMQDWEAEAEKMGDVYSSAYCTLAASSAESSTVGFLDRNRPRRETATVNADGGGVLYICPAIDNFHKHVEASVLNSRGWVFQERALSRRILHFTSVQMYWECGHGIRCETLARLRSPTAAFMSDSNFPEAAREYFKGGRILHFQYVYQMYSKLAFSRPTDRSIALHGLEDRMGRAFRTRAAGGLLEQYRHRSLLWRRGRGYRALQRIAYGRDEDAARSGPEAEVQGEGINSGGARAPPSWSWMAFLGGIEYVAVPFGETEWCGEQVLGNPFEAGLLGFSRGLAVGLRAVARGLTINQLEWLKRVTLDVGNEVEFEDRSAFKCVVVGQEKERDGIGAGNKTHYALIVQPAAPRAANDVYQRVGVGELLAEHILNDPESWITIV